jgi:hypothetical protein
MNVGGGCVKKLFFFFSFKYHIFDVLPIYIFVTYGLTVPRI